MEDIVATTKKVNIEVQEENKNQQTNDLEPDANETCSKCKQAKGNLKRCDPKINRGVDLSSIVV